MPSILNQVVFTNDSFFLSMAHSTPRPVLFLYAGSGSNPQWRPGQLPWTSPPSKFSNQIGQYCHDSAPQKFPLWFLYLSDGLPFMVTRQFHYAHKTLRASETSHVATTVRTWKTPNETRFGKTPNRPFRSATQVLRSYSLHPHLFPHLYQDEHAANAVAYAPSSARLVRHSYKPNPRAFGGPSKTSSLSTMSRNQVLRRSHHNRSKPIHLPHAHNKRP